jgi:hypothetical protein
MAQRLTRHTRVYLLIFGAMGSVLAGVISAQQKKPVAAMFGEDQKRGGTIALSFATAEVAPTAAGGFPLQVYLTAGDLARAFDRADFRPDAAIVPTNTALLTTAAAPATQLVLIERVRKQSTVLRDLEEQIAAHKAQSPATADVLNIGVDTFVAPLPRPGRARAGGAFPKIVCLVATDFANGGAIDRRELFAQDRVRKGIASCLTALDASGAQSLVLPLMGAATSGTQSKDPAFEGQRVLKECRLLNSVAGIALGIHDFAPNRRNLREIGVIQYDQEIVEMFSLPKGSRVAQAVQTIYQGYADQTKLAFRKGLDGQKTTAADVDGSCNAIFSTL